jgi:hypothetical protein
VAETIDISAGNYGSGKTFSGVVGASDPSWVGATGTFYVYIDQFDILVLDDIGFPTLSTKIARVQIASGVIMEVIDERAEVNGLVDAYQVAFDDTDMFIATPADDVQEAIDLLDSYVSNLDVGADIVKYIDLDIGGGIRNALVRLGHLTDAPAVEFPKRPTGVGRVRYTASVPKDWVNGTDIIVKIFWSPEVASSGDVNWRVSYKVVTSGTDTIDTAVTTVSTIQAAPGVLNRLTNTGGSLLITSGAISAEDILIINVEREYSVSDTFNSTARMHLVRLEYTGRGTE